MVNAPSRQAATTAPSLHPVLRALLSRPAAAVMGVNTTLYKILAFALCSVFAAVAGGIHAYWITYLDPGSAFDVALNVKMIIMAVCMK